MRSFTIKLKVFFLLLTLWGLFFLSTFQVIWDMGEINGFFLAPKQYPPVALRLWLTIVDVLLAVLVSLAFCHFLNKFFPRVRRFYPLALGVWLLVDMNILRNALGYPNIYQIRALPWLAQMLIGLCGLLLIRSMVWSENGFRKNLHSLILIFLPFVLWVLLRSAWIAASLPFRVGTRGAAIVHDNRGLPMDDRYAPTNTKRGKYVWLIFDEFDYDIAFNKRPAGFSLPNLDAFRQQSFHATQAYPPARNTMQALPSLYAGMFVESTKPLAYDRLDVKLWNTTQWVDLSTLDSVFYQAKHRQMHIAYLGWRLPLFRMYSSLIDAAYFPHDMAPAFSASSLMQPWLASINVILADIFQIIHQPFYPISLATLIQNENRHATQVFHNMSDHLISYLEDSKYDLVVVHFPVPHQPYIYNYQQHAFTVQPHPLGYYGNLYLVDKTLGEAVAVLKRHGIYERSAILVSADHFLRDRGGLNLEHHQNLVPYIWKLPGQNQAYEFNKIFNTVITRQLWTDVMDRKIESYAQLATAINQFPRDRLESYDDPYPWLR